MTVHLDYADESFRQAWRQGIEDPATVESLTRGGRALVRVARDLEEGVRELSELRRELEELRVQRDAADATRGPRGILLVREVTGQFPAVAADDGVQVVDIDLTAIGGREGFSDLPREERTAWLNDTGRRIDTLPDGAAHHAASALWRAFYRAFQEADGRARPRTDAPDAERCAGPGATER